MGRTLCPENDELRRIAVLKVQGYLDSARTALISCKDPIEAGERLLNRFAKLPGTYSNILLKLAEYLWEAGEGSGSTVHEVQRANAGQDSNLRPAGF